MKLELDEVTAYNEKATAKKKRKKKRSSREDLDDEEDDDEEENVDSTENSEQFLFHPKTCVCDITTPEALILSLFYGSGFLLINSDEFKVRGLS